MSKLEDIYACAGPLTLTASELVYIRHALGEHYLRGGWCPEGENRRDFSQRVCAKFNAFKLDRMVTPDGSRRVSVEEHAILVAEAERVKKTAHVVMQDNGFRCLHCGDSYTMTMPVDIAVFTAAAQAYRSAHQKCTATQPAVGTSFKISSAVEEPDA